MALSFQEIKNKVTGQQRSGTESFDEIKARVSKMNMVSPLTVDDVNTWFAKSRELAGKTNQYIADSGTYDGWKNAPSPYDELNKHRLQEASVRAWLNSNKDALGDQYNALIGQFGEYSGNLGRLSSGIRDTSANWRNSPLGELDASISTNEQKLSELKAQLDKTGDQWYKKTLSSLLSERKPIKEQIKGLETENKRLQDERLRYLKAYNEAGLLSNPDALIPKPTLGDNLNALRLDATAGISSFSNSIWKALDWLIPDEMINNGENFMRDTFDTAYASHNDWLEKENAADEKASEAVKFVGDNVVTPLFNSLPHAAVAMMSGGATAAPSLATAGASTGKMAASSIGSMVKNPSFWASAIPTFGSTYDEAIQDGASELEATATAILNAFAGSAIEISGGIETIPSNPRGIRTWVKGMLDEGKEEVLQGIVGNLAQKAIYDHGKEWLSLSNPDAVINPQRMLQEGAGGVVVGGILGGGMQTAGSLMSRGDSEIGSRLIRSGDINTVISTGLNLSANDPLYSLAAELAAAQTEGTKLSPQSAGKLLKGLYLKFASQSEGQTRRIPNDNDAIRALQTSPISSYTKSKTVQNGPSSVQESHSGNADIQTDVPYVVNTEAAKPLDAQARKGDASVTVQGVESVQGGDVTVSLSDGTKVPLYDVEIADPQIRQLYDTAAKYDTNTARAFVSGFDGSLPISTYQSAFDYFMTQAKHGVSMDEAMQHAGLAGQMMSPVSRQTAYFAGENLKSSETRGNMRAENVVTGGAENGEKNLFGRHPGRKDAGNSKRSGEKKAARGGYQKSHRTTIKTPSGKAEFESVREESLNNKQKRDSAIAKEYGYDLYHVPEGSEILFDGKSRVMEGTAFIRSGFNAIFAEDGTNADYVHHELFHQFMRQSKHGEGRFLEAAQRQIDYTAEMWNRYYEGCKEQYGSAFTLDVVYEEIACDLCEYAMSGSEKMYNRLNGLFEGDALETLAEQAREVFEANLEGGNVNVSVRQDTGAVRGFNGGAETGDGQRSGISKEAGEKPRRTQSTSFAISDGEGSGGTGKTVDFQSVKSEHLSNKQKKAVSVGSRYGYPVYYLEKGELVRYGNQSQMMDKPAFVIPGVQAVFAMDGIDTDFIYHELFHQFFSKNAHGEKRYYQRVYENINEFTEAYDNYRKMCENAYGEKVSDALICEEIAADLSEYAKSGSRKMQNRLEGLFMPGQLEKLAERARGIFDANLKALQRSTAGKSVEHPQKGSLVTAADTPTIGPRYLTTETADDAVTDHRTGEPPEPVNYTAAISTEDSLGNILTDEQQHFFANSQVRDDNGNLMVVYHSSHASEFTVFDKARQGSATDQGVFGRGFYFSSDLDFSTEFGDHTRAFYLNIQNPYRLSYTDTSRETIRYLRKHGTKVSPDIQENLPILEFAKRFGYSELSEALRRIGHDGVIISGEECVIYEPNQAKLIDNLFPSDSADIRFYLEDVSPVDVDVLTEENQKLREQVETLRDEFKLTKGHKIKPASIEKLVDSILKETRSSYDKGTLAKNLDALFSYIANDPEANFDEAMDVSVDIANSVLRDSSALDSTLYDRYKDMRDYFRKTAISLPEDIRAGMDYERFRKEQFGGIRLTNDGESLDSLWPEISERWPEFFAPDTPIQDQPQIIADALRTVKPSYVNPYGMDATEAAVDLAMRVYEEYFNLPEIHTFADKKKAELTQLRAKYENRIQAIRKGYKAKEQALVQEQRQKRKDLKDDSRLRMAAQMEKVREQRKAATAKRQESALVRRYKPRIIRDTMELGRWLTHPTDKKHVPEPFRKAVAEFVNTIDFSSNRLNSKGKPTMRTMAMQKLFNQMNTILKNESGAFDEMQSMLDNADPDLIPNMADLIQNAERVRIEDMTGAQLKELAHTVAALKSMLSNTNSLISGEQERAAEKVAQGIQADLMAQKEAGEYTGLVGLAKRLISYDMMDAPSYFEELGDTAYKELYRPLRRGFDRKIRNTSEAVAYMQRLLKGIDTDTWSGPKAEKHTFKVKGGTVSLTTAQIMSLYELSKRDQAMGHIMGGGITPSDTVKGIRIEKGGRPVTLTARDLAEIVGTLTPEQRAVADGIADFFKITAEWGNEVSMKLYGYRKFTEQNYFPIVSDKNYLATTQGDLKRQDAILKNLGMTKSAVAGANNPIMVEDIFDVFTRQADQMGSYNAFVVPLSDLNKVFNFKVSGQGGKAHGSVKESLGRALGHDAITYWNKLVEDINGVSKQTPPTIGDKLLSNMKAAAVGANLRVIVQQPTAYLRAAAMVDPKYLAKGLATKSDIDEMNEYAPIAYWKDLGFFEMDTARGMKDILMGKKGLRDLAMKPAGWMDTKTWGKLWNSVKAEIQDTTDFKPGTVEFLEAAGERFSEIIDRTQVVDSVLHRSQMMRSKNFINKTVTSFMSEPTKAYNMLRSAVRDVQKNGWKKGWRRLVRVTVTHAATNIATALAAALIDFMRDDDEEKKWWEKYLSAVGENTLDNLSPLNMLPYLKDAASLLSGYNLTRQEMAGLIDVVNAGRAWMSYFQGDSKYSIAWLIKNSAASISKITGIPVAAAMRDLEALVGGSIRTLGDFGVPTTRLEYILDTFYYPVIPKNASRYAQHVYDAYQEKNPKLAKDILEAMEKGGISEEKIAYYMRKNLRERDDRIAEAGRAKLDGNMSAYARIVGELRNEGFDREWVVGAVDGWVSKSKNDANEESDTAVKTNSGSGTSADESLFDSSDVVTALEAGNTKEAKAVIKDLKENGKEESSIRSTVTRYYKPIYQDLYKKKDENGMRKIREALVSLGIGYKSGDFTRWIQDMNK